MLKITQDIKEQHKSKLEKLWNEVTELKKELEMKEKVISEGKAKLEKHYSELIQ